MKRVLLLVLLAVCCSLLVQCPMPWHEFDNPVDPKSLNYIGKPSQDNDGNGVPQYIDVEEIELVAPVQDAVLDTLAPVLETYRFNPELVKRYWLQIATVSTCASGIVYNNDALSSSQFTVPPGTLNNNTTYFWRAKAFDGTKWSTDWSETRAFTIHLDMGVPGSPVPANGVEVADYTPDFDWSDVAGAEGYQIQIGSSSAMELPLLHDVDSLVASSFSIFPPLDNGTYYWRVRIKKGGQWGDWSTTWSFTVITATEINLKQGTTNIPSGSGAYSFGSFLVGSSSTAVSFTVENQGTADLIMNGTPVTISGSDAAMFSVGDQPLSLVAPSGTTSFTISFTPTSVGAKTATVSIPNNDTDENPYTFTVTGTGTAPEINLKQGSTDIPSGSGSCGFGTVLVETSSIRDFTVENLGTGDLLLTGSPKVVISGPDAVLFSASAPSSPTVAPSGSASFTITFSPTSPGPKSATVSIANTDSNENPYTFILTGTGATIPEINLKQGGADILSGSGTYGFGSVILGSGGSTVSFTVENSGTGDLVLTGTPLVAISGLDAVMFTVVVPPNSPVAPSSSTNFSIRFNPTSVGAKTATVTIANNDADEYSYTFGLTGMGTGPEINVKQGGTDIASGGSYAFGSVVVGSSSGAISFTVQNLGNLALNLSGSPRVAISGLDASMFSASVPGSSTIAAGSSTTFTITFNPGSVGAKSATVSIANDDSNENPYTFALNGTGVTPEIDVKQGVTPIASVSGSYNFGNVVMGSGGLAVVFTVENNGSSALTMGGTPKVVLSGADVGLFNVTVQPASPVAAGSSTTFTITFNPGSVGAKSAAVSIANNDLNENPYTFGLSGAGVTPEIDVKQGVTPIVSGGSYDYGNVVLGTGAVAAVFTVENNGSSSLTMGDTPKVVLSGADVGLFNVTVQPGSPVAAGSFTTFTIIFNPGSVGAKSAAVSIANDDLNENPYTFSLSGTGIVPDMNIKQGISNIATGTGSFDFVPVLSGTQGSPVTFTIENLGEATLNLTGIPDRVVIGGTDAEMFSVTTQPDTPVAVLGSTTFAITFWPLSPGLKTATVSIASDDPDENPYTFTVKGVGGTAPEINVRYGSDNLHSGDSYDFGDVMLGPVGSSVSFSVENLGTVDLNLTGTPTVAIIGTDWEMFTVDEQPTSPIAPIGSRTFAITFKPTSVGAKTATVSIANNDSDENPYTFSLTGTGTTPEINLSQEGVNIESGVDSFSFGSFLVGSSSGEIAFTIENLGSANLILNDTPKVLISGTDVLMFTVVDQPTSPVAPAGSATFTITFIPDSIGPKTATVTIVNNDLDENPYTFTILGTGS